MSFYSIISYVLLIGFIIYIGFRVYCFIRWPNEDDLIAVGAILFIILVLAAASQGNPLASGLIWLVGLIYSGA